MLIQIPHFFRSIILYQKSKTKRRRQKNEIGYKLKMFFQECFSMYIVVYGRNELDLENTTINVASEINKCGLNISVIRIPIHKRHKFCKKQFACDRLCLPFTVRRIAPHKRISCAFFARAQGKNFLFLVYQNLSVRRIRKFRETCGVDV